MKKYTLFENGKPIMISHRSFEELKQMVHLKIASIYGMSGDLSVDWVTVAKNKGGHVVMIKTTMFDYTIADCQNE